VKAAQGNLEGALADYAKTIALKPDYADAYVGRGYVKRDQGDLDAALADYTKAISLRPGLADAYAARAYLRYDQHSFPDALVDFRKGVELRAASISMEYTRFRIWLIRARLGEAEAATGELQQYLTSRTVGQPDDWPSKITRFLIGQLTEAEFLTAAKHPNPKTEASRSCEAYFYAGSKRLISGDKTTASEYFQKSLTTNEKAFTEYRSAVAELKNLKEAKQ
jgi:lipoprotein NlpI